MNGSKETMGDTQRTITELLRTTKRDGMGRLVDELLDKGGFFVSPASTKFHGAYPGGLAQHSLGVYKLLIEYQPLFSVYATTHNLGAKQLPVTRENLTIAALLHDVCKIGSYIGNGPPYKWNRSRPKGHAILSLIRIAEYIRLEPIEEMMIRFHMGTYGTFEFDSYCSEYPIRGDKSLANAWHHNPIVKLMYICDELDNIVNQ